MLLFNGGYLSSLRLLNNNSEKGRNQLEKDGEWMRPTDSGLWFEWRYISLQYWFWEGKLNDLIDVFPEYSNELRGLVNRLKDLMTPFQQKWYYTPEMKGSYSIKLVLPALVPELSYDDLPIKEGGTASNTFLSMVNGTFEGDVKETRRQLLQYCELDT